MIDDSLCLISTGFLIFLVFLKSPTAANQAINMKYSDPFLKNRRKPNANVPPLARLTKQGRFSLSNFLEDGLQEFLVQERMIAKGKCSMCFPYKALQCSLHSCCNADMNVIVSETHNNRLICYFSAQILVHNIYFKKRPLVFCL